MYKRLTKPCASAIQIGEIGYAETESKKEDIMKKRVLAMLLCLVMVLSVMSIGAAA